MMRPSYWHQNVGINGLSAPAQGQCTCLKSWKNVHTIRGQRYFWNMQPVIEVIRPFCLHLPCGYIDVYEIKQNIKRQNGSFWNWYKMMGIIKALKCCQNLYQVVVCPCPGAFLKWWPWVDLDLFSDRVRFVSWCFYMGDTLYSIECSCISMFVLIYHILSTQVSDTGPMVLWFHL